MIRQPARQLRLALLENLRRVATSIGADRVNYSDGFFTDGSGANTLRLNFSHAGPDKIEEGIKRLGEAIAEHLAVSAERRTAVLV